MNPEQILSAIEICIKERKPTNTNSWLICWRNGNFQCIPSRWSKNEPGEFGFFLDYYINTGLTLDQWDKLKLKAALFFLTKR